MLLLKLGLQINAANFLNDQRRPLIPCYYCNHPPPSLLRIGIEHGKFFRTNQPKPGTPPPAPAPGPKIKNWRDLGSEPREGKRKKPVVRQLSQGEDEDIRQLPTVVRSSQSNGTETAWTDWSCGKTTC